MKPRHVMIKVQTVGLTPEHALVSIGAVLFDPRVPVVTDDVRQVSLAWQSQGRVICQDALEAWRGKPGQVQKMLNGTANLQETLTRLTTWLPKDVRVWGNGPSFDIAFLEHAYRQLNLPVPWRYWNIRCCRTILDMYNEHRGALNAPTRAEDIPAVETAVKQAQAVCMMWQKLASKTDQLDSMRRKIQVLNDPRMIPKNQRRTRSLHQINKDKKR